MNIFVQFHNFEQVIFEIFELLLVALDDFFLRGYDFFHFLYFMGTLCESSIKFHFEAFRFYLLIDSMFLICFFSFDFFDHEFEVLILIEDILEVAFLWVGGGWTKLG